MQCIAKYFKRDMRSCFATGGPPETPPIAGLTGDFRVV